MKTTCFGQDGKLCSRGVSLQTERFGRWGTFPVCSLSLSYHEPAAGIAANENVSTSKCTSSRLSPAYPER